MWVYFEDQCYDAKLDTLLLHQVAAPAPQDNNNAAAPPLVEEEGKEFMDLSAMLEHLGLSEYKSTFDDERIDAESFVRRRIYLLVVKSEV